MKLAPHTLLVDRGDHHVAMNLLHGRTVEVPHGPSGSADDLLRSHKCVEATSGHDDGVYDALMVAAALNPALRLGFRLDDLTRADIDRVPRFVLNLPGRRAERSRIFLYAWCYSTRARGNLRWLAGMLDALPGAPADRLIALFLDGAEPFGDDEYDALEGIAAAVESGVAVFTITKSAVDAAGGSERYCRKLFEQQSRLYAFGLLPQFVFRCDAASADFMIDELFTDFCFSGIYPRDIFFTFSKPLRRAAEQACELYGWDWDLYAAKAARVGASRQHQVVEPLSSGLPDKVRALLRDRFELPSSSHCPFSRNSFVFGHGGSVGPCPVVIGEQPADGHERGPMRFGTTRGPGLDEHAVREWEGRTARALPTCRSCAVAPYCAGGCPLEAVERHGSVHASPCPPISRIIDVELDIAQKRGTRDC